jgi:hypothetical protein
MQQARRYVKGVCISGVGTRVCKPKATETPPLVGCTTTQCKVWKIVSYALSLTFKQVSNRLSPRVPLRVTPFGFFNAQRTRITSDIETHMEPAMALAIMCAFSTENETDALRAMVKLARVLADLNGKIPPEDWESLVEAGAALWSAAMGDYNAEQLTADVLLRARRR